MSFSQRVGNFFLSIGVLCLFVFAVDLSTFDTISTYEFLLIGLLAFGVGWWFRFIRKPALPPPAAPPPPRSAPAPKNKGLLGGLFKPKPAPPPPKPAAPPPPKKGLAALFSPKPKPPQGKPPPKK
jgi:hypothetical protein